MPTVQLASPTNQIAAFDPRSRQAEREERPKEELSEEPEEPAATDAAEGIVVWCCAMCESCSFQSVRDRTTTCLKRERPRCQSVVSIMPFRRKRTESTLLRWNGFVDSGIFDVHVKYMDVLMRSHAN